LDVRDQILITATRRFAKQGFEGTSLQDIADDVGVRKQSVLYHFPSKDALRAGVHQKMLDHWNEKLPALLAAATSGEDQFDAVVSELVAFFTADEDRARLVVREVLDRPGEVAALMKHGVRPWVDIVANNIRKGQAHGDIHADVDPEAYVLQVINLVVAGVATRDSLHAIVADDQRYIKELVRVAKTALFTRPHIQGEAWRTSSRTTTTSSTTSARGSTGRRSSR
jgi:AcrR family transcriptional regulator